MTRETAIAVTAVPLWAVLAGACVGAASAGAVLDIQAHRGGSDGPAPPGTLDAHRHAIEVGATTLELDAQVTADGVLVVHHDQALARSCRGAGGARVGGRLVRDVPWSELADVECEPGQPLPRVGDILRLARSASRPVHVSIEMKMQDPDRGVDLHDFARLLVDLVEREGMRDRTLVQSFLPEALREVSRLAPDLPTAILSRRRGDHERLLRESGARVLAPRSNALRAGDVERFHAQGVAVIPWTVNDPDDMRRFVAWGVDGLITDHTATATGLFGEWPIPAPAPEGAP